MHFIPSKISLNKLQSVIKLMRWHKPTGTVLTLTPALWSLSLFTPDTMMMPDLKTVAIFSVGAFVARGMGCTVNDILDRKYDRLVERTKNRPIANGDISVKEGIFYLTVQSFAGLYVLCQNNAAVIKLGLMSGPLIASYPLFKRFTYWPQLMLACTINWGVPMGFAAVHNSLFNQQFFYVLPVYFGSICWTMYYDTVYAHQDKTDDLFVGIKSSALKLGSKTKPFLYLMTGGMASNLAIAGLMTDQTMLYFGGISLSTLMQIYQVRNMNLDDSSSCLRAFNQQTFVGFIILVSILASTAQKYKEKNKCMSAS